MKKPIEIHFGDIHTYPDNSDLRFVIVDVGQDDWFSSFPIVDKNGRIGAIYGTGYRDYVAEIVGNIGLQEIIEGLEKTVGNVSGTMIEQLKKSSLKPPRILE